jgi:hypothetical protein
MSVTSNSGSLTASGAGVIAHLRVGKNSGSIKAKQDLSSGSGALNDLTIGSLTTTGTVSSATADNMTVTTLEGSIQVTQILNNLSAGTIGSSANLSAGHFNVVKAQTAAATVNFAEPGVTRTLSVTPHHNGDALPRNYGFYYDGQGTGDPNVTLLFDAGPNAAANGVNFDVSVLTDTTGSGFDLAGIYAVGQAFVHNIVVGGDLVPNAVSSMALGFLGVPANSLGGVQLPHDTVAVAVGGTLPAGSIVAQAVPALAAASFAGVPAATATHADALAPLAAGTSLTQANDTFVVFVGGTGPVAQFLVTGPGGSFDAKPMLFADQGGNSPVTATDTLFLPSGSTSTEVSAVLFQGQGGSLTTAQPINVSITSDGSLGDLVLSAPQGLPANVMAQSIVGNIDVTNGGISGTIQTKENLGRTITDLSGNITGVTSIQTGGGGLTGKIIVGGNLISTVELQSGMDGVIAVQGDIGAIQTNANIAVTTATNALIRFGGITVSTGGVNGQVVAIGNVFGDINVTGGLSGRIVVKGNSGEYHLASDRFGILGNVSISGGIGTTGAIVSAGRLGDNTGGTLLSISGKDKGILAAKGGINPANISNLPNVFTGLNAAAVDAIFTNGSVPLTIPGDLGQILLKLAALHVDSNGKLTD